MNARHPPKLMSFDEATEAIVLLCREFDIEAPVISWSGRAKRGRYYSKHQRIALGPNCWRGVEYSMLHEFAHHLQYTRGGKMHDEKFWTALRDVTTAWFGNPAKYHWHSEYKTGQKIAAGLGILNHREMFA